MAQQLIDPVIQKLEHDLPNYLASRRWFRAKAQIITGLHIHDIVQADGFPVLVIEVKYSGGCQDLYLLAIHSDRTPPSEEPITSLTSEDGNTVIISDAVYSPFFRTILFRALSSGAQFEGTSGILSGSPTSHALPVSEGILESFVSRAEQSNTSIIFGRDFILKLFRKIETGINPDVEIAAFLTAAGFKNTPAIVGTLEYRSKSGDNYSAGILQEFVSNEGDAWKYTIDALTAFYPRALNTTLHDPSLIGDYAASAALLGTRTAELHIALSQSTSNPDFQPEPFTSEDAQILADQIAAQAKTSLDLLRDKAPFLPHTEQTLAHRVIELEPRIIQAFSLLPAVTTEARRIRYHGDYHLGQVLATGTDFMIIDFEGEPARPLRERREKALALRDVAGMLRSFHYAAYAGLFGLVPGLPTDAESVEKISECSAFWNSQVSKLYLDAYLDKASSRPFIPDTPEQQQFFLNAFLLQKALYEVQYELNNRPAWIGIPLRGILSLIDA